MKGVALCAYRYYSLETFTMTFPRIQFKTTRTERDASLENYAETKFAHLAKYLGYSEDATCHVEFEKLSIHGTENIYRAEVTLFAHGKTFRAEQAESSFRKALDTVQQELADELSRSHKKHDTLVMRGRRMVKEWLLFGKK